MQPTAGGDRLRIEFLDRTVAVTDQLDFGRRGDLVIDETNRYMHRRTGRFVACGDHWWLENLARRHPMVVLGLNGLRSTLPAGTRAPLTSERGVVAFQSGHCPYELTFVLEGEPSDSSGSSSSVGTMTAVFAKPLSTAQATVLAEFARSGLQHLAAPTPTYAEVAQRLNMRPKAVDHVLADVRNDLRAEGVTGIDSIEGLTTHLIASGRLGARNLADADRPKNQVGSRPGP